MNNNFLAGAAAIEITPQDSQFLYGYPHVERYSTGVHDSLFSSALYVSDGQTQLMFITNDIIFISKQLSHQVRQRISNRTGMPASNIIVSATHTHSGPITVNYISNESDPVVPKADEKYLRFLEDRIYNAATQAYENALPAKVGFALADSTGIGTNRHDPAGPADHQVPVLMATSLADDQPIACMLVCSMHPTVLHENSTLISGDFPGLARQYVQTKVLGRSCPVLHFTGPAGNQSPRHVTTANTFAEAERLGRILGNAIAKALPGMKYQSGMSISCASKEIDLPRKSIPSVEAAASVLTNARESLARLRREGAAKQDIRTAECDWFGAEETLTLAKAADDGRLEAFRQSCLPAEIAAFRLGTWAFVAWPGEVFVDYALAIKKQFKNTFVISLANGELQGYITTPDAAAAGYYEASNALFSHESGRVLVDETVRMIEQLGER